MSVYEFKPVTAYIAGPSVNTNYNTQDSRIPIPIGRILLHFTGDSAQSRDNESELTVVSGKFEFNICGEKRIVTAGDTMLKKNGIEHGCVCLEAGILLDIFSPMREDFVK